MTKKTFALDAVDDVFKHNFLPNEYLVLEELILKTYGSNILITFLRFDEMYPGTNFFSVIFVIPDIKAAGFISKLTNLEKFSITSYSGTSNDEYILMCVSRNTIQAKSPSMKQWDRYVEKQHSYHPYRTDHNKLEITTHNKTNARIKMFMDLLKPLIPNKLSQKRKDG
jgi:hypothetical protein